MITRSTHNMPVSAPQCNDVTSLLTAFRAFRNEQLLSVDDLVLFITTPSPERLQFLLALKSKYGIYDNSFLTQYYTAP